jgi:hypothetical protein
VTGASPESQVFLASVKFRAVLALGALVGRKLRGA